MQPVIQQAEFSVNKRRFLALREETIVSVREFLSKDGLDVLHAHSLGSWDYDRRAVYALRVEPVSRPSPLDDETPLFLDQLEAAASVALREVATAATWLEGPRGQMQPVHELAIYREGASLFAARQRAPRRRRVLAALALLTLAACEPVPAGPVDQGRACCTLCSQRETVNGCPPSICLPVAAPGDGGQVLCCDWSRLNPLQGDSHAR